MIKTVKKLLLVTAMVCATQAQAQTVTLHKHCGGQITEATLHYDSVIGDFSYYNFWYYWFLTDRPSTQVLSNNQENVVIRQQKRFIDGGYLNNDYYTIACDYSMQILCGSSNNDLNLLINPQITHEGIVGMDSINSDRLTQRLGKVGYALSCFVNHGSGSTMISTNNTLALEMRITEK